MAKCHMAAWINPAMVRDSSITIQPMRVSQKWNTASRLLYTLRPVILGMM